MHSIRHFFTESEALTACSAIIDEFEEEKPLSEERIRFAKLMFSYLTMENAKIVLEYYPFRDIIAKCDMVYLE